MYKKITAVFAFATILSAGAFAATTAKDAKQQPKITMEQARATALKKAPGKVTSEELENEKGKLIYSFDIATSKTDVTEVNVDAMNGKIVAVQHENAAKEAAEKKQEAKEKSKKQ
jgi:regulator of RNase E activity RraB